MGCWGVAHSRVSLCPRVIVKRVYINVIVGEYSWDAFVREYVCHPRCDEGNLPHRHISYYHHLQKHSHHLPVANGTFICGVYRRYKTKNRFLFLVLPHQ